MVFEKHITALRGTDARRSDKRNFRRGANKIERKNERELEWSRTDHSGVFGFDKRNRSRLKCRLYCW